MFPANNRTIPSPRVLDPELAIVNPTGFIRRMGGGSQSSLISCDDGYDYVVKFNDNPQGRNLLANEYIGSRLLTAVGITTPIIRAVYLDLSFLKANRKKLAMITADQWYLPSVGFHFGSRWVPEPGYSWAVKRLCEDVSSLSPSSETTGILLFDLWADNQDAREYVQVRKQGATSPRRFYIDGGNLFGDDCWGVQAKETGEALYRWSHAPLFHSPYVETWCQRFEDLLPAAIERTLPCTWPVWYEGEMEALRKNLLGRLAVLNLVLTLAARKRDSYRRQLERGLQLHLRQHEEQRQII